MSGKSGRKSRQLSGEVRDLPKLHSFRTMSGKEVRPLYSPEDPKGRSYLEMMGFPGEPPFARGVHATMYRGRLWTMREYAGFGTAEETNKRYHYLISHGNRGLSVAFDLPTQMGYDSDHKLARGEVGRVGVAICGIHDMSTLFRGIDLSMVSTSMTINATAIILLALYVAVAESQDVSLKVLRGTVQNDILKEFIARSTYIFPPEVSLKLAVDVMEYCALHMPKWNAVSVSGYHIREAGATASQEVAFTLADAIAYVEAARSRGLDPRSFLPQLAFFFNAHIDFFEEIAKFRAARKLWAEIVRDRFGIKDRRCQSLRFHAQTAGTSLTAQQPENNIVRVTLQALAAVLGGAQSLHTNSMDEAISLPSEKAVRIALRTQQILAHESGVVNTADPAGGSWYVESLTEEIGSEARDYLERIDKMGGTLRAIEGGFIQREIAESAYRYQMEIEKGERVVVGVNRFSEGKTRLRIERKKMAELEERQIDGLRRFKWNRDMSKVRSSLKRITRAAQEGSNIFPSVLSAVRHKVTLGEITDSLREVFGEFRARHEA